MTFTINGLTHSVDGGEVSSLAQYIREVALLTGTKISCGEGGCGACIVTVRNRVDHSHWFRSVEYCALIGWDYNVDKPAFLCHKDRTQGTSMPFALF